MRLAIGLLVFLSTTALAIDDERLLHARSDGDNWLTFGRDYTNQRFSPLAQINVDNVSELRPAWTFRHGGKGAFQAQALVADGTMFVTLPGNGIVALNGATGELKWRYKHQLRYEKGKGSVANRGAALAYGLVFEATNDGRLVALDQDTGQLVWDRVIAIPTTEDFVGLTPTEARRLSKNLNGLAARMPPLVYRGMVIVGVTAAGYGIYYNLGIKTRVGPAPEISHFFGKRGFVAAYDARNGDEIWRWYTTSANGWEGGRERQSADEVPQVWRAGGSSTWSTPSLDPELGLLYLGTGNASPNDVPSMRSGDNLYASSLVALDVTSGALRWHYQQVPHDVWGYDVASASILFDYQAGDQTIPAVGIAGKTGWFYVHDRRSGDLLYRSEALVPQDNMFTAPTAKGITIAPGSFGGVSWSPGSYNPSNNLAYFGAIHRPTRLSLHYADEGSGKVAYIATDIAEQEPSWGLLAAVDTARKGVVRWRVRTDQALSGGVLATAGDVVFVGEGDGNFSAFNANNGERLWQHACGAGVNAPPVSYAIEGRQYIAVAAGGNRFFAYPPGDLLVAFALAR